MGCEWEIVDRDQIFEIEPALKNNHKIIGGVYTKSDATGDIHKYCFELAKVLEKKYGVDFKFSETIKDIKKSTIIVSLGEKELKNFKKSFLLFL